MAKESVHDVTRVALLRIAASNERLMDQTRSLRKDGLHGLQAVLCGIA
jgi:hypothetical protein